MALSKIFVAPKNGQGGVKKSKKFYFFKKYIRKMEKTNFGTSGRLWDHFWPKSIFGDMLVTSDPTPPTPLPPVTVTRLRPKISENEPF